MDNLPRFFLRDVAQRVLFVTSFALLALFILPALSHAATVSRYWILGPGNWDDTAHWSTSSGGAGGASAPVAGQEAHFDRYSGGGTVTLNAAVDVSALHLSSAYTGTLLQTSNEITVGTGHLMIGSGRILGGTSTLSLSGSYTQTGGIVTLQRTFSISGSLSVTKPGSTTSPATSLTTTGAIIFEGKADQNITKGDGATLRFGAVTINNTGAGTSDDIIVNSSGALTMSGHLTVTLGNLDLQTRNIALAVGSGITIANAGQATMVTDANITASGHVAVHGAGTLTLSGTMTLTLDGRNQNLDTNATGIPNLVVSSLGTATLTRNEIVSSSLSVSAGSTLSLGTFQLSATSSTITNLGTINEGTGNIYHTATNVLLTDSAYVEDNSFVFGDLVYVTLTDSDENIDGTAADTVSVNLGSGPDTETVVLVETTVSSGIFRNSIPSAFKDQNINAQNGTIEASSTATLTLTFTDAQDALFNADTATLAAAAAAASSTTTTTATSSGGGGGGGGSRRGAVLSSKGLERRQTTGGVVGGEMEGAEEEVTEEEAESSEEISSPWSDLDLNDPHADATMRLYAAGIVKGNDDGTVQLNRSLSRVEALTLLVRTLGEDSTEGDLPFSDVDPAAWYAGPLRAALNLAIIKGFPDGTFRPSQSLNLVQSLKIISIALGFADQSDESLAANWYDPYVTVGREAGLIHGSITPDRTVTRGEFFEWLALLLP